MSSPPSSVASISRAIASPSSMLSTNCPTLSSSPGGGSSCATCSRNDSVTRICSPQKLAAPLEEFRLRELVALGLKLLRLLLKLGGFRLDIGADRIDLRDVLGLCRHVDRGLCLGSARGRRFGGFVLPAPVAAAGKDRHDQHGGHDQSPGELHRVSTTPSAQSIRLVAGHVKRQNNAYNRSGYCLRRNGHVLLDEMRRIALIPLLLLALAAAGCGAGTESDDAVDTETTQQEAAPIAAQPGRPAVPRVGRGRAARGDGRPGRGLGAARVRPQPDAGAAAAVRDLHDLRRQARARPRRSTRSSPTRTPRNPSRSPRTGSTGTSTRRPSRTWRTSSTARTSSSPGGTRSRSPEPTRAGIGSML